MANTTIRKNEKWDTLHENGSFRLKKLLITHLDGNSSSDSDIERYNDTALEIRRLIGEARDAQEGFRAYGSRWSLSLIAQQKDRMHFNRKMKLQIPITKAMMHSDTNYEKDDIFFFQCGATIKKISLELRKRNKSLKTTGASNGQTIAGCISTGVHGSAIEVGSVQDYVVGLNIIIGDTEDDVVYLERESKPALSNAFAKKINARVIRDDELFNAALVGLGSFGFIHGVALEAEDRFLLNRYVRKIDKEVALQLAETMDFKNSSFKISSEVSSNGKPLKPYHYKVFINPYVDQTAYVAEVIYKKRYKSSYPDPFNKIQRSVYRDLIFLLIKVAEWFPKAIPKFIKALEGAVLPAVDDDTTGTLAEIFWDSAYKGPAFAFSFGVDHKDSRRALKALTNLTKDNPIPGLYAMRFVKRSKGTLAFTKFPTTCMIEIDGIQWKKSNKMKYSMKDFSRMMIEALKDANIDFTMHWGKNAKWNYPNLCLDMYGSKVAEWQQQRARLLSPEMQEVFTNDFLQKAGLANGSFLP